MYADAKSSNLSERIARRSWNILRLALFGNKHNGLAIGLSVFSKLTRKLVHNYRSRRETRGALAFGDHEFSFDETPIFHMRIRRRDSSSSRFRLPCTRPQVDFDCDEDFISRDEDEEMSGDCEIDLKAEEFIAKFYEQMKLQRLTSITRSKTASFN